MTETKQIVIHNPEILALQDWARVGIKGGIVPPATTGWQALCIVQTGKELGLPPMQAFRSMSFIKGKLTMSVQLQLALAREKGVIVKAVEEKPDSCAVTLKRGTEEITCSYTLADAKKAGLVRQDGNYDKYLRQMLRWRAIGDGLRIIAPDAVMGLLSPEEAESIEEKKPFLKDQQQVDAEFEEIFGGKPEVKPEVEKPTETPLGEIDGDLVTEEQIGDLFTMASDAKINVNKLQNHAQKHYPHIKRDLRKLTIEEYKEILEWIKATANGTVAEDLV